MYSKETLNIVEIMENNMRDKIRNKHLRIHGLHPSDINTDMGARIHASGVNSMQEYADVQTVAFSEWLKENSWRAIGVIDGKLMYSHKEKERKSLPALLIDFKNANQVEDKTEFQQIIDLLDNPLVRDIMVITFEHTRSNNPPTFENCKTRVKEYFVKEENIKNDK